MTEGSTAPAEIETSVSSAAAPRGLRDLLFRWRGWGVIVLGALALAVHGMVNWPPKPLVRDVLLAAPLVLIGVFFRVWARCHFTRGSDTRRIQAHRLIVAGPYRRVRNPLYVGNLAIAVGLTLAFAGPWTAGALLVALVLLYSGVIRSEEAVLERTWGESYVEFRRQVPRWLPRLRPLPADPDSPPPAFGHALRKERQRIAGALGGWALALLIAWMAG
jgi:protein-S-isoprenylcysteine O-methyltransferase Ste14